MEERCIWLLCFYRLSGDEPRFFGFAEFLTALALMVLAWTITDVRYRFRVRTAPIPMQRFTFCVVVIIGLLTLLTDLWRSEQWYVPKGDVLSPGEWQGILAAILLLSFLTWIWFAFVRPPRFGQFTAKRFVNELYGAVLRGQDGELAVISDELGASMSALVGHAPTTAEIECLRVDAKPAQLPMIKGCAHDIFWTLADPRLVKALVASSPRTALELFWQMSTQRRYPVSLTTFARNFVAEAIRNRDSFLYHETEAYESGLLGSLKPLTTTMFGKYEMVDALNTLLDGGFVRSSRWDEQQVKAYGRLVVLTLKAYVRDGFIHTHSAVLSRAFSALAAATSDVYTINGMANIDIDNDAYKKLSSIVRILVDCISVLDTLGRPGNFKLRRRRTDPLHAHTIYDTVAEVICEVIFHASAVRGPRFTCWSVQHNAVWGNLFHFGNLRGPAGRVIKHKVRRLLYDDIIPDMTNFPNYKAAALLGFCLNVLGHKPNRSIHARDSSGLTMIIVHWVRVHYVKLHASHPAIAEHCLLDDMTYDAMRRRIFFASPGRLGQHKPHLSYLQLI